MKRYILTWYNYIAQGQCTFNILAKNEEEAVELGVRYLNTQDSHTYDEDDIDTITCIEEMRYLTKKDIENLEKKSSIEQGHLKIIH